MRRLEKSVSCVQIFWRKGTRSFCTKPRDTEQSTLQYPWQVFIGQIVNEVKAAVVMELMPD